MPPSAQFKRGAKPSSRAKLLRAIPHFVRGSTPAEFAAFPTQLSMWDNDKDGDCVTAEEAAAKGAWSKQVGLPDLFIPDAVVVAWATQYGFLNGADLTTVMDQMAKQGFTVNGVAYGDGPYTSVDYSDEAVLQNAISLGPVKIGIDADALPSGAGNGSGWFGTGGKPQQYTNEDHCVGLLGYGTATYIFQQLFAAGLITIATVPAGLNATATGYALFTWSSIGFVDHAWIMSTVGEAWLRNPTTPGQMPPAPLPTPTPPPSPAPTPVPLTEWQKIEAEFAFLWNEFLAKKGVK